MCKKLSSISIRIKMLMAAGFTSPGTAFAAEVSLVTTLKVGDSVGQVRIAHDSGV